MTRFVLHRLVSSIPVLFGIVLAVTDSYRPAIFALIAFFVIGGLLLTRVDTERGIREAGNDLPRVI